MLPEHTCVRLVSYSDLPPKNSLSSQRAEGRGLGSRLASDLVQQPVLTKKTKFVGSSYSKQFHPDSLSLSMSGGRKGSDGSKR